MDRILIDKLIDSGELTQAEESLSTFEELFVAANQLGWDSIPT